MYLLLLAISSLLVLSLIAGHELCLDTFGAVDSTPEMLGVCSNRGYQRFCCSSNTTLLIPAIQLTPESIACRSVIEGIACSRCDAWAAHLYDIEANSQPRNMPFFCSEYCKTVFEACRGTRVVDPSGVLFKQEIRFDLLSGEEEFCVLNNASASNSPQYCYDGKAFVVSGESNGVDLDTNICLSRVFQGPEASLILDMHSVPDMKDHVVLARRSGLVQLINQTVLGKWEFVRNWIDLRGKVWENGERGLLSVAFHPNYAQNRRFFVSYSCANCPVECGPSEGCNMIPFASCGTGNKCTGFDHASIISEFQVLSNGTVDMKSEKIFFRLAQPWGNHNGGQILFDPNVLKSDAQKLFIMLGDGGQGGDPLNSGQNASTFLGSILRIDVDSAPDSNKLYSVPKDNPFYKSNLNILPEIWSYGLRNPWRCSFDRNNTFYFYCGDVGQNTREEISLITKGGNMGWNKWEGTYDYRPSEKSIPNDVKPILEYSHNINLKGHSICGGFVYRSDTADDLDLAGKYIFADYIGPLFVGSESAPGSGKFSYQRVSWGCSKNSPMKCPQATGTIYSMAQDYKGELYFLTDTGIYKLSSKGLCDPAQSSLNDPLPDDTELYVILPFAVCFIVVFTYFIHARYFSKAKSSNIEETSPKNPPK